jgi:hypothetical protein
MNDEELLAWAMQESLRVSDPEVPAAHVAPAAAPDGARRPRRRAAGSNEEAEAPAPSASAAPGPSRTRRRRRIVEEPEIDESIAAVMNDIPPFELDMASFDATVPEEVEDSSRNRGRARAKKAESKEEDEEEQAPNSAEIGWIRLKGGGWTRSQWKIVGSRL